MKKEQNYLFNIDDEVDDQITLEVRNILEEAKSLSKDRLSEYLFNQNLPSDKLEDICMIPLVSAKEYKKETNRDLENFLAKKDVSFLAEENLLVYDNQKLEDLYIEALDYIEEEQEKTGLPYEVIEPKYLKIVKDAYAKIIADEMISLSKDTIQV